MAAVNQPYQENAATVQGPSSDGQGGYPLGVVPLAPLPAGSHVTVDDILDGAGVSIMDAALNAAQVSVINNGNPIDVATQFFDGANEVPWSGFDVTTGTSVPSASPDVNARMVFYNSGSGIYNTVPSVVAGANIALSSATYPGFIGIVYAKDVFNNLWNPLHSRPVTPNGDTSPSSCPWLLVQTLHQLYSPVTTLMIPQRNIEVFNAVATAAAGNTALWTPAAGKKFRLMRYCVTVTADAATAGGAVIVISLFDAAAGATGQVHSVFCPAAAGVGGPALYVSPWIDLGNGVLSAAANNVLNVNLSAALTAGIVNVICCGTEE